MATRDNIARLASSAAQRRGNAADQRIAEAAAGRGSGVHDRAADARRWWTQRDIDLVETSLLRRDQLDRSRRLHLRWTELLNLEDRYAPLEARRLYAAMLRKAPGGVLTEPEFQACMRDTVADDAGSTDLYARLFLGLDVDGARRACALDCCLPLKVLQAFHISPKGHLLRGFRMFADRSRTAAEELRQGRAEREKREAEALIGSVLVGPDGGSADERRGRAAAVRRAAGRLLRAELDLPDAQRVAACMAKDTDARAELARMVADCWRELPGGHVRVELPFDHVVGGAWGEGEDHNVFQESMPLYGADDVVVVQPGAYGDGQGDATNRGLNWCVARVVAWRDAEAALVLHMLNSPLRNRELGAAQRTWRRAWPVEILRRNTFFRSERAAVHSYGPDPHSRRVLRGFLTGRTRAPPPRCTPTGPRRGSAPRRTRSSP